jgi:hypothetical protein
MYTKYFSPFFNYEYVFKFKFKRVRGRIERF